MPPSPQPAPGGIPGPILEMEETGFTAQAKGPAGVAVLGTSSDGKNSGTLGAFTGAGGTGVQGTAGSGSGQVAATLVTGVWGDCESGNGVNGTSASWNGVEGDTWSSAHAGVAGVNHAGGPAVLGSSTGNAGQFEGNVLITGSLTIDGPVNGQTVTALQSSVAALQQQVEAFAGLPALQQEITNLQQAVEQLWNAVFP
jgi:hypothetical protein